MEAVTAALQNVDVGKLVGIVLDATVAKAARVVDSERDCTKVITAYHATLDPHIPVPTYIQRMEKYGRPSPACFLHAVVLMDRLITALPQGFVLSGFCVHRLLGMCVLLAHKMNDDVYYSNAHWCRVLGIALHELNAIELTSLKLLRWRVHVDVPQFLDYLQALVSRAEMLTSTNTTPNNNLSPALQQINTGSDGDEDVVASSSSKVRDGAKRSSSSSSLHAAHASTSNRPPKSAAKTLNSFTADGGGGGGEDNNSTSSSCTSSSSFTSTPTVEATRS